MSATVLVQPSSTNANLLHHVGGRRRSSTVSVDSAPYLPQHLAVREWQIKERERQVAYSVHEY